MTSDNGGLPTVNSLVDEQRNLKKACNHLERMRMRIDKVINEPMSIGKMTDELEYVSKQAQIAHRRIIELFVNKTDLFQRLDLGNEYGQL